MGLVPYLMVTCHRGWVLVMISNLSALVMISNLSDLFFHLALSLKVSIRLTFVHMVILLTVAVVHLSRENTDHSKLLFQMKGTQHLQTLGTISSVILHIVHFGFFLFFLHWHCCCDDYNWINFLCMKTNSILMGLCCQIFLIPLQIFICCD